MPRTLPGAPRDAARRPHRLGFSLAELAMGIVLVGVVTGAALPHLARTEAKALRRDALLDLRAFASAQGTFHERHGRFATLADVTTTPTEGALVFGWHRGVEPVAVRTTRRGWSAEVRLPSGTRCALVVGAIRPPDAVPGLVAGVPACEP